jgi:hypothetical protein
MAHPDGGQGNYFHPNHTFDQVVAYVGEVEVPFISTTGEKIIAIRGIAQDGITPTIVFKEEKSKHGNVCQQCWGYRRNCNGTRIGQCNEALDRQIP